MASEMKEVSFPSQGSKPVLSTTEKPKPAKDQLLVKSLWTAMNPVDGFVANMGLNVDSWPAGLGADASGVVVEVGEIAFKKYGWKVGDYACGCTRIGPRQYSTCREFFLMDAAVTMHKPSNLSVAEAATIGAACQTAAFGILQGLRLPTPKASKGPPADGGPWVLVIGGSGSVGRAGVQLARAAGAKVIGTCSKKNVDLVKGLGAHGAVDYRLSLDEQIKEMDKITKGDGVTRIFDATSADNPELAKALFKKYNGDEKLFSTTNDWSGITDFEGGKTTEIHLGMIGRPDAKEINRALEEWNPMLTSLYEAGTMVPMPYEKFGDGLEAAVQAYGKTLDGKKVVVQIQDE